AARFIGRGPEHRLVQSDFRRVDLELRRVNSDGEASGAGLQIVARERTLSSLVEAPRRREGQRMRGDDGAVEQAPAQPLNSRVVRIFHRAPRSEWAYRTSGRRARARWQRARIRPRCRLLARPGPAA